MRTLLRHWLARALGVTALTILNGCVAGGGGFGDGQGVGVGVAYGADFYEPYGYEYGGWGGRYHVGPPRGGYHRPGPPAGRRPPAYRPAEPSRAMPSIPVRTRQHQ